MGRKFLGEMEESLITADVGVKATDKLMQALRRQSPGESEDLAQEMSAKLQAAMVEMLRGSVATLKRAPFSARPWVIIFLGVNGVGKTTTIGKLAAQYRNDGKKVLLVAGDTFRAAAIEQLDAWVSGSASMSLNIRPVPIPRRWSSMACKRPKAATSMSCSSIPPAACTPRFT